MKIAGFNETLMRTDRGIASRIWAKKIGYFLERKIEVQSHPVKCASQPRSAQRVIWFIFPKLHATCLLHFPLEISAQKDFLRGQKILFLQKNHIFWALLLEFLAKFESLSGKKGAVSWPSRARNSIAVG